MTAPSKKRTKQILDISKHLMRAMPDDYYVEVTVRCGGQMVANAEYYGLATSLTSDSNERKRIIALACNMALQDCLRELI